MQRILNSSLRVYVALFVLAGAFGIASPRASASASAQGDVMGCWYDEGTTPRCQYCEDACGAGQVCCRIVIIQPTVN